MMKRSTQPSYTLISVPNVADAAVARVEAALGEDWDVEKLEAWLTQAPAENTALLKAWGALDMQFSDENYGSGGWSPLMCATTFRSVEARHRATQALLDAGANVNLRTPEGTSVLGVAMMTGDVAIVQALLHRGADPNVATLAGLTPLHHVTYAAIYGDPTPGQAVALARALLDAGAEPMARTFNDGTTPLQFLVGTFPDVPTVDLFIEFGADPFVVSFAQTRAHGSTHEGDTLLHEFRKTHASTALAVLARLLDLGLDPNATNAEGVSVLEAFVDLNAWDKPSSALGLVEDDTSRARACYRAERVKLLVDRGAQVNRVGRAGLTPFQTLVEAVVARDPMLTRAGEIEALVMGGADLSTSWGKGGNAVWRLMGMRRTDGRRVLTNEEYRSHERWVEGLVLRSTVVSLTDPTGSTPDGGHVRRERARL